MESLVAADRDVDEEIERMFRRPAGADALVADRRPRPGRARAAAGALAHRRGRPRDPHPRRLPPRPDHAHRPRLGDPRLRGRARAVAARAAPQALAAARRGRACCARSPTPPRRAEPARRRRAPEGWEERAREAFLDGYLDRVDSSLLPPGQQAIDQLLAVFELEKAVYELRYELNNRPDWVGDPGRRDRPAARRGPLTRRPRLRARHGRARLDRGDPRRQPPLPRRGGRGVRRQVGRRLRRRRPGAGAGQGREAARPAARARSAARSRSGRARATSRST